MANPIAPEDLAVVERLMDDDAVLTWLNSKRPRSAFHTFVMDKDTWRTLLTAVAIPVLGWLALKGYNAWDAIHNKDAHLKAAAEARAIETQADTRHDVEQVVALMPYLSGTDAQRSWSLPALKAMQEANDGSSNPFSRKMFAALMDQANKGLHSPDTQVQQESRNTIELLSPAIPAGANVAPATGTSPANAAKPFPIVRPSLAYIQYYGATEAPTAQRLANAFRTALVPVPGIEDVVASHPDTALKLPQRNVPAVRYYRAEDEGAARFAADLISKTLKGPPPQIRFLKIASQRGGIVEIWLPCGADICR